MKPNEQELRDAVKLLETVSKGVRTKILARTEVDGLTVSTVETNDMGPETAVIDAAHAFPVERYETQAEALAGHNKWCEMVKGLTAVKALGYGSLVDSEVRILKRRKKHETDKS